MHLLIACAALLVFVVLFDLPRVKANGLLFVLRNYVEQASRRVTVKRVIYTIGVLLFVMAAWQAVGLDWAFVAVGGDVMLYLEIASTIYLMAFRGHIHQVARLAKAKIILTCKNMQSRLPRSRDRREPRRHSSADGDSESDAVPARIVALALC